MKLLITLLISLTLALASVQASSLAEYKFDTPAEEKTFRELIEQLRCLVCQNESLAGSQAELAQDLRREVYEMMQEGKSKEEIINFLVARYGDFVLYNPPLKPETYPLWFGPFILIGIATFFLARTLLRKKQARDVELSDEQRQRLDRLLKDEDQDRDDKS